MTKKLDKLKGHDLLVYCEKQLRRNARYLHWWNPFRFLLVDADANLRRQTERLRKDLLEIDLLRQQEIDLLRQQLQEKHA